MKRYKVSEHDKRTLSWWRLRKDNIDFEPKYQRKGGLWTPYDKAYLIDSIVNGFDVPKIYMADFTWITSEDLNPNHKMYAVIDGKQRLEAAFDFLDDKIALNSDFVYFSDQSVRAGGMKFSDLQSKYPHIAEEIEQFNLSVVSVVTQDIEAINELFLRLNRSKPLTGAEIRNAMKGDTPKIIRQLSEHYFFKESISFNTNRGQDKNAAAKILMFCFYGEPKDTKKKDLDEFAALKDIDKSLLELAYRKASETLEIMASIFLPRDKLLKSPGLLPVYFLFVKELENDQLPLVRSFIDWFEARRNSTEQEDFIKFQKHNRSTNDQGSFIGRKNILIKLFKEYEYSFGSVFHFPD